ncbi:hypothetical protein TIFTF001_026231 [Ficus carica]|uniref:Uncharacterized protein n=1 Tax=Ficus carica TaxID=3494 RepID=A0AA88DKU8_FICCA|nr:hypothetical protein TIFTF001_026231 [Ficus carica]
MKPPEFEGSTNSLEAEEWLTSLQIVLNFMDLTDQEKVNSTINFNNRMAMKAQQNEFNNIKQGTMVRRMLDMFHREIAVVIDSGEKPPTTVTECVKRALRAEYRLAQAKQERAKFFEE